MKFSIQHLYVQTQQKNTRNVSTILKVNNDVTRTTSVASIVNFEHISHFILLLLLNSNKSKYSLGLRIYSFRQWICFQQLWEMHFPMGRKILLATFSSILTQNRLQRDNFSRQRSKKISRTLLTLPCFELSWFFSSLWLVVNGLFKKKSKLCGLEGVEDLLF